MVLKNAKAIELIDNNAFFVKELLLVDDLTSLGTLCLRESFPEQEIKYK